MSYPQGQFTQDIKGIVVDKSTQLPLPGANIIILDSDPLIGCVTDEKGRFRMANVPVGRQSIRASFIGYEPLTLSNLSVMAGKELVLNIELEEAIRQIDEVVISSDARKDKPINDMAVISARSFTVNN